MWRRIEIRNYRSIEHVTVDLAPFTVVVGPNGSGKSNFADALVFAHDIASDASVALQKRGGITGVRRWRPSKPLDVMIDVRVAPAQADLDKYYLRHCFTLTSERLERWSFKHELFEVNERGKPLFVLERDREHVSARAKVGRRWIERPLVVDTNSSLVSVARHLDFIPMRAGSGLEPGLRNVRRYRFNLEAMRPPQLVTERSTLDESGGNIAAAIQGLRKTALWKPLLLAMRKFVPRLVDIREGFLGRYMVIQFFQQQEGSEVAFSAMEMSDGTVRALGILVAAQQLRMSPDGLLIIEEPEVSIHTGAAKILFGFLQKASESGAILLTTHSSELLDTARNEEILVCDDRDGVTSVGPMEFEQRRLVKEGLLSAAELMSSEPLRIEGMLPAVISHEEAR